MLGAGLEKKAFRRKIEDQEIVEPASGMRQTGKGRPAQLYRLVPGRAPEFSRAIRTAP